ncbi:hypothetical protein Cgig2_030089 [Carnegiea gigantea]|uniref:Uncharacterized protein n=1 Tax=Carnegiea gigantea TaxID=171969 RepID=A0A9Q1GU45_9CARY|nr:hypothetical protein Cgig2_030089 [Carnegiea gigantea]
MYQLAEVLKSLRKPLKQLNNIRFKDVYQQLDINREKLENIQMQLHQDYQNSQLQQQEKEARDRYLAILDSALKLIHQQSKIEWSNKGVQCSRLSFAKMKQRKQANYIYSITNAQGQEARGFNEVAHVLSDFYQDLLGRQQELRKPVEVKEEIKWGSLKGRKWYWKGNPQGRYSVSSGYKWYLGMEDKKPSQAKMVWSKTLVPRQSLATPEGKAPS